MRPHALIDHLERVGPQRSGDLRTQLRVSAATLHRMRAGAGAQLVSYGRARASTLAARRRVPGIDDGPLPVWHVDREGAFIDVGHVQPIAPFGHLVTGTSGADGWHHVDPRGTDWPVGNDLPWFLADLKPEGHLGRAWLRRHPGLPYPQVLPRWDGDHLLHYLVHHGVDLPGALVVGHLARAAIEDGRIGGAVVPDDALNATLTAHADAEGSLPAGSSPGGEQPKFTLRVDVAGTLRHLLVKFSPPLDQPSGRRWADLLVAEHLALQTVAQQGIPAARTEIRDIGARRHLLVERFDRHGARGRSGVVSLAPFDTSGAASDLRRWSLVTRSLVAQGRLNAADHDTAEWLEAFGHAIANTDMHLGNLSLQLEGLRIDGLAPVYDMLPMHFAPRPGGEVRPAVDDAPTRRIDGPRSAATAACRFWEAVAADPRVSPPFRALAHRRHQQKGALG